MPILQILTTSYKKFYFFQRYLKKAFCHEFSFPNRFAQTPHHLNGQNLLSMTKLFLLMLPYLVG